jgi:hypothetical protein
MTISLAFLAPDLVRAAVEGRLPRGIDIERLRDTPAEWSRQFEALGLNRSNNDDLACTEVPLPAANPGLLLSLSYVRKEQKFPRLGRKRDHLPARNYQTALAHVIGDKAEQAYRRSDALDKRRKLMKAWAAYCEPKTSGNVVQIRVR